MLPALRQEQYRKLRARRRQKTRIKSTILQTMCVGVFVVVLMAHILPPIRERLRPLSASRSLLSSSDPTTTISGYPADLFTSEEISDGAWLLYLLGMMYTFIAIALVCDEWFVPAIEEIVERLDMTPDTAGATWMAAGGSAPELFTNIIAVFIAESQMGFGTIVGSAVFNVLFVIGCCAIATPGHLPLTWWPFARDCIYYIVALSILAVFYRNDRIEWFEALLLLLLYVGYVGIMTQNQRLHRAVAKLLRLNKKSDAESVSSETTGDESGAGTPRVAGTMGGTARPSTAGVHFHASFYDFLTKDSSMTELMGVHVVARMKGETKETFAAIDADGNGYIDRHELRMVLKSLGEQFTDNDLVTCFSEIDENNDGKISFEEFEHWYLASKLRMTSDIKRIFEQFDDNGDDHIDALELRALLQTMNEGLDHELTEQELGSAMDAMGKTVHDKISEREFVEWYSSTSYFEEKTLKRQATLNQVDEDEGAGIEIEFPEKTCPRIWFVVTAPIMYTLYYTLPDVQKERRKHLWPLTFVGSMVWLMFYSYLMVWWATRVGQGWGMNTALMGLTFVAAGTSVPDLLSSVIVAKLGQGDMAVSSSIGSNIFDILVGLPGPWLVYALINGTYDVEAGSLFSSLIILVIMLIAVLISIMAGGWKLSHKLGWAMFVLWVCFVTEQVLATMDCCDFLNFA